MNPKLNIDMAAIFNYVERKRLEFQIEGKKISIKDIDVQIELIIDEEMLLRSHLPFARLRTYTFIRWERTEIAKIIRDQINKIINQPNPSFVYSKISEDRKQVEEFRFGDENPSPRIPIISKIGEDPNHEDDFQFGNEYTRSTVPVISKEAAEFTFPELPSSNSVDSSPFDEPNFKTVINIGSPQGNDDHQEIMKVTFLGEPPTKEWLELLHSTLLDVRGTKRKNTDDPKPDKKRSMAIPPQIAQTDRSQCEICMENERNCVLEPCNHAKICMKCAESLDLCPFCRQKITRKRKVFL